MKRNRKILTFTIITVLVLGTTIYVNADKLSNSSYVLSYVKQIGNKLINLRSESKNNDNVKVIAKINNEEITEKKVKSIGALINSNDYGKIIDFIGKSIATVEVAEDLGVTVTDEEAFEYMNDCKNDLYKDEESTKITDEFISSLVFEKDEYWNSEDTFSTYKKALIKAKLKQVVKEQLRKDSPNISINELAKKTTDRINELINKKKSELSIERYY